MKTVHVYVVCDDIPHSTFLHCNVTTEIFQKHVRWTFNIKIVGGWNLHINARTLKRTHIFEDATEHNTTAWCLKPAQTLVPPSYAYIRHPRCDGGKRRRPFVCFPVPSVYNSPPAPTPTSRALQPWRHPWRRASEEVVLRAHRILGLVL